MNTTIPIECTNCQAKFAGKSEYAGRRIKCPKCEEVFRVEETQRTLALEDANRAGDGVYQAMVADGSSASAAAEPFDEWNMPADFEYKMATVDDRSTKCTFCGQPTEPDQVLCMRCGYHRTLKKKIELKRGAEAAFEDEKPRLIDGRIDLGTFSIPILPLAIAGGVFALMGLVLLIVAPLVFALLCGAGGLLLVVVGQFWVVFAAFREDILQGLLVWFLPFYALIYIASHWDETWLGVAIWAVGCFLLFIAFGIIMTNTPEMGSGLS